MLTSEYTAACHLLQQEAGSKQLSLTLKQYRQILLKPEAISNTIRFFKCSLYSSKMQEWWVYLPYFALH